MINTNKNIKINTNNTQLTHVVKYRLYVTLNVNNINLELYFKTKYTHVKTNYKVRSYLIIIKIIMPANIEHAQQTYHIHIYNIQHNTPRKA